MSVINVTNMWSKTGGSLTATAFDPMSAKWSITEGYQVLVEPGDDITVVANAPGLPLMGSQHPSGAYAYLSSISPAPMGPTLWVVTLGYEGVNIDAPTVTVEWSDTTTTEPIDRDYDGNAIVTANGEQVDGLTVDVSDQVVVIKRQFTSINTASIAAYRRATNSDTFLGWAPGTARLIGFSAVNQFSYGSPAAGWDVTARIQFREPLGGATSAQAWYKRWRHEGLLVKVDGVIRRATDDLGQEETKPVLLATDGTRETDPSAAVFKYTQVYGSLPYSGLGLI